MFAATISVSPSGAATTNRVPLTTITTADRAGVSGSSSTLLSNRRTALVPPCLDLKNVLEPESDSTTNTFSMTSHRVGTSSQNLFLTA